MAKLDLKKEYRHLYNPSSKECSIVDVPELQFLMVDGAGDPNTSVCGGLMGGLAKNRGIRGMIVWPPATATRRTLDTLARPRKKPATATTTSVTAGRRTEITSVSGIF